MYGSYPHDDRSPLETQENVLPFLSGCASLAPTFMSLGNHELYLDDEDNEEIEKTGVTVLDNEWRTTQLNKRTVVIGGLTSGYVTDYRAFRANTDSCSRYPRQEDLSGVGGAVTARSHNPKIDWLDDLAAVPGYHILLSHHPEIWPEIKGKGIELVLSGHAHGGQWRIFGHGVWSPGQGLWPRWTRGVYDGRLIVSAGLSNTTWIPRFGNPTEVVYINTS